MRPQDITIDSFDYHLPEEKIAKYPLKLRDQSKLLWYNRGMIAEKQFNEIGECLPEKSLLVFNNSRVIEARLHFQKKTGGLIEIFALEPNARYADITVAMNQTGEIHYQCLVGGAAKWKAGEVLQKQAVWKGKPVLLNAAMVEKGIGYFNILFSWEPAELPFAEILHLFGKIPIPPYLKRETEESDQIQYQTVYAEQDGSVAAPTAGLHFTQPLLSQLKEMGVGEAFTTLHVGAGTFMPVKTSTMAQHDMHAEFLEADIQLLEQLIRNDFIIPVGTTSMRTLESLYWMGVKAYYNPDISIGQLEMQQWEVYDEWMDKKVPKNEALSALMIWLLKNQKNQIIIKTQILIAPGYSFGICKGLITNFHQPKSTLLLLVAALIGDDWKKMYRYALEREFRFLSYGDSSLLLPGKVSLGG